MAQPSPHPELTAVIPTRNRAGLLAHALDSVLRQEDVELEAIVVDEASSDETPSYLSSLDDPRVRVIRNAEPQGVASARNAGIAQARGAWIACLDDDDLWAPRKSRAQIDAATAGGWGFAICAMVGVDATTQPTKLVKAPDAANLRTALWRTNPIGAPSSVLMDAEALRAARGFDEKLSAFADWDMWLRLAAESIAGSVPEPLTAYREHGQNMMASDPARLWAEFEILRAKHGPRAAADGATFGDLWELRWDAIQDLAEGRRGKAALGYLERAARERSLRYLITAAATATGSPAERLGRNVIAARAPHPPWLDRYRRQ